MKKILSLVFACILVFSQNAAFAASWVDGNVNTATAAAVTIEVAKYVSKKDATGQAYYSRLDDAAIVKAGDGVAFQAKITVPSVDNLNNQFKTTVFHAGDVLDVKIDGTNLRYGSNLGFGVAAIRIGLTAQKQTVYLEKALTAGSAVRTVTDLIGTNSGMYLDEAKEYGAVDLKVGVQFFSGLSEIAIREGDSKYKVARTATSLGTAYAGPIYAVTGDGSFLGEAAYFVTEDGDHGKAQIKEIYVGVDGCIMKVVKINGVYQCNTAAVFGNYTAASKYTGDEFLNRSLGILGFSAADALYDGSVYMDELNWAKNFGVYFSDVSSTAYAAFIPVPVTIFASAQTDIPKTGSCASPMGFVLLALGLASAAVVVTRRIRV